MSDNNSGGMILALLLGGAIGAFVGVTFATQSGKDTRKRVKVLFDDIGVKTGEIFEEGKDTFEDLVNPHKATGKK